ncbi:MAG: alpha/beta fold hydrolase, partial [Actinobacteria bacterium]
MPMCAAAIVGAGLVLYELRVLLQLSARPDPDADRDFRFPGGQTRLVPTADGGHLHIEECGVGRPVLLLHGHGASMRTFSLLAAPLLAGGRRVIAMDQRGFGRSSPVPPMFGFPGLVDDAAAVLEALDLRDTVVVGHSMGGGVALGLAIDRPAIVAERVSAIVLINSSGR